MLRERGLAEHRVNGIGHGLGLRFEETPASTIIPGRTATSRCARA